MRLFGGFRRQKEPPAAPPGGGGGRRGSGDKTPGAPKTPSTPPRIKRSGAAALDGAGVVGDVGGTVEAQAEAGGATPRSGGGPAESPKVPLQRDGVVDAGAAAEPTAGSDGAASGAAAGVKTPRHPRFSGDARPSDGPGRTLPQRSDGVASKAESTLSDTSSMKVAALNALLEFSDDGGAEEDELRRELDLLRTDLVTAWDDISSMAQNIHARFHEGGRGPKAALAIEDTPTVHAEEDDESQGSLLAEDSPLVAPGDELAGSGRLQNGGFEQGSSAESHEVAAAVPHWAVEGGCGVLFCRAGSSAAGGLTTLLGNYFLGLPRPGAAISQPLRGQVPGARFQLRLQAAVQAEAAAPSLRVSVGGRDVGRIAPTSGAFSQHVLSYDAADGAVLRLENIAPGADAAVFVDNVESEPQPSREASIELLFEQLDVTGLGLLRERELRRFAELLGFDGGPASWPQHYHELCRCHGFDAHDGADIGCFSELVSDVDGSVYCTTDELNEVLVALQFDPVWAATAGEAYQPPHTGPPEELHFPRSPREQRQLQLAEHGSIPQDSEALRPLDEAALPDMMCAPELLWPWLAVHAPQARERRAQLARTTKSSALIVVPGKVPSAEQAIALMRWCWRIEQPGLAAAVLLPLFVHSPRSLTLRWVTMLVMLQLWRHSTCGEEREYVVDNSELNARTLGLNYRRGKHHEDIDHGKTAEWGAVVSGLDKDDGWLKVGELFLPMTLDGTRVLSRLRPGEAGLAQREAARGPKALTTDMAIGDDRSPELIDALRRRALADLARARQEGRLRGAVLDHLRPRGALETWVLDGPDVGLQHSVRSRMHPRAEVLERKSRGETLFGYRRGAWLELADGSGYCLLFDGASGCSFARRPEEEERPPLPHREKPEVSDIWRGPTAKSPEQLELERLRKELVEQSSRLAEAERLRLQAEADRRQLQDDASARDEVKDWHERVLREPPPSPTVHVVQALPARDDGQLLELRQALSSAEERSRDLQHRLALFREAAAIRQAGLQEDLRDAQLEIAAARERQALCRDIADARVEVGVAQADEAPDPQLVQQLQAALRERDSARSRALELREELRSAQRRLKSLAEGVSSSSSAGSARAALSLRTPRTTAGAVSVRPAGGEGFLDIVAGMGPAAEHLQPLVAQVADLQERLMSLEAVAGASDAGEAVASESAGPRAALARGQQVLGELREKLRRGAADLAARKQRLRELSDEDLARADEEAASSRRFQAELTEHLLDIGGERRELAARLAYMRDQNAALLRRLEERKQRMFVLAAALLRGSRPLPKSPAGVLSEGGRRGGTVALVRLLALTFGWPEVAFLMIDIWGKRRLTAEDFGLGLLLGAGVDYHRVTGMTVQALFANIDRRGAGSVTAADFADCCLGLWQKLGADPPTYPERLRALPWGFVGDPAALCEAAPRGRSGERHGGVRRSVFEDVVVRRLRGLDAAEAAAMFAELSRATGGRSIPPNAWLAATAEVTGGRA